MKHLRLLIATATLGALAAFTVAVRAQVKAPNKAELALRAAMEKETVAGDLKAAIEEYRKIATTYAKSNRAAAARALLRMGQCYEKLGNDEARKAYQQLISQYGDLKETAEVAKVRLAALGAPAGGMGVVEILLQSDLEDDVGRVSPNGRYYAYTDWTTGALALRDLATGEVRRLTPDAYVSGGFAQCPEWNGDSSKVMYVWKGREGWDIRTVRVDGKEVKTHFQRKDWMPWVTSWSADGSKALVYLSGPTRPREYEYGILDVATGGWQELKINWWQARFSPDGKWIAHNRQTGTGLYLANAQGEGETVVSDTPGKNDSPEWSADGKRLAFVNERTGPRALWSVAVSEGKVQGEPAALKGDIGNDYVTGLSRDGALFFTRIYTEYDLYEAAFDPSAQNVTGEPRLLVAEGRGRNRRPRLSPDGDWLAFTRRADPKDWDTWLVVVRSMKTGKESVLPVRTSWSFARTLGWSSDSKVIEVLVREERNMLAQVNIETGSVQKVEFRPGVFHVPGNARYVTKSPDGNWLAFVAASSSGSQESLYVVPAAGGPARELAFPPKSELILPEVVLRWSTSSDRLYFAAAANAREKAQVWTVPLSGGEPQPTGLYLKEGVTFAPDGRRVIFGDGKASQELWVIRNLPLK